jgi:predicted secreted protein
MGRWKLCEGTLNVEQFKRCLGADPRDAKPTRVPAPELEAVGTRAAYNDREQFEASHRNRV